MICKTSPGLGSIIFFAPLCSGNKIQKIYVAVLLLLAADKYSSSIVLGRSVRVNDCGLAVVSIK